MTIQEQQNKLIEQEDIFYFDDQLLNKEMSTDQIKKELTDIRLQLDTIVFMYKKELLNLLSLVLEDKKRKWYLVVLDKIKMFLKFFKIYKEV